MERGRRSRRHCRRRVRRPPHRADSQGGLRRIFDRGPDPPRRNDAAERDVEDTAMTARTTLRPIVAILCLMSAPVAVRAEDAAQGPGPTTQGPMIIERVKSGFLVAPDFKVTEVDRRTAELAGGYA